jgi:hypothetical protein
VAGLIGRYLVNLLIAADCATNAALGGSPYETLSSRLGKARQRCRACYWICRMLHLMDPDHCQDSIRPSAGDRALWRW